MTQQENENTNLFKNLGRKPHPMDVHVGSRVRFRRMFVGLSQEKLGEKMSLSFQQVQKYEKGANRIGASRLFQISQILDVPVQFFFDDELSTSLSATGAQIVDGTSSTGSHLLEFLGTRDGIQLNQAFLKITSLEVRKQVIELVNALSKKD